RGGRGGARKPGLKGAAARPGPPLMGAHRPRPARTTDPVPSRVSHYRLLVPTTNPARSGPVLKAISPFLNAEDSRGTLLGVIEIAPERSLSEGVEVARAYRALLSRIARYAEEGPGELRGLVRIAHVAAQGIREAALETHATLRVLAAPTGR